MVLSLKDNKESGRSIDSLGIKEKKIITRFMSVGTLGRTTDSKSCVKLVCEWLPHQVIPANTTMLEFYASVIIWK